MYVFRGKPSCGAMLLLSHPIQLDNKWRQLLGT